MISNPYTSPLDARQSVYSLTKPRMKSRSIIRPSLSDFDNAWVDLRRPAGRMSRDFLHRLAQIMRQDAAWYRVSFGWRAPYRLPRSLLYHKPMARANFGL